MQVGKIPWSKEWQPTPVFLRGKPHGQRSLAGYNPWGLQESDTTSTFTFFLIKEVHTFREEVLFILVVPSSG